MIYCGLEQTIDRWIDRLIVIADLHLELFSPRKKACDYISPIPEFAKHSSYITSFLRGFVSTAWNTPGFWVFSLKNICSGIENENYHKCEGISP